MTLTSLIIQIILTIPLTIINEYLSKRENNRVNKILIPTVYMVLAAALIPSIKENIFLIVVFEIFIRNFYISNISNKNNFISNTMFIIDSVISVGISLFTYNFFISKVDTVIPNPEEIKPFLWFLCIIYVFYVCKKNTEQRQVVQKKEKLERKKEYTIMQYAKFKNKYNMYIKSKNKLINDFTYAVMINETYKTSNVSRKLQEYIGAITKKETKYGIMRIDSYTHLSDAESIKIFMDNLEKKIKNTKDKEALDKLLSMYEADDQKNVKTIYNQIIEFTKN